MQVRSGMMRRPPPDGELAGVAGPTTTGVPSHERSNCPGSPIAASSVRSRSEEHTSELQSRLHLACPLLLEQKKCVSSDLWEPHPLPSGGHCASLEPRVLLT